MSVSLPARTSPGVEYTFDGVRVDTAARRVWVDGEERKLQPLVFNLLCLLCEQPRQVIPRDVLFQRLWPDGSFPSDLSLSQLVFKLRNLLAGYGGAVVTVRHVGLRLDADVTLRAVLAVAGLAEAPTAPTVHSPDIAIPARDVPTSDAVPADPRAHAQPGARAARRRWLWALGAVLVLSWLGIDSWRARIVDVGYGLRVSDLGTWRPGSVRTIQEALDADAQGARERATALLEAVTASDPDALVPPLLLGAWWAASGQPRADEMVAEFRRRMGDDGPRYLNLMSAQLLAGSPLGEPSSADRLDLLLAERPQAWRFRLARAHWHIGEVDAAGARSDLQAIPVHDLGDRAQLTVLMDRIAVGDGPAVQALLRGLPTRSAAARRGHAAVHAWLKMADGDAAGALAGFEQALAIDVATGTEVERRLHLYAAIAAGRQGRFDQVRAHVHRARTLALQLQRPSQAAEAGLLLLALPDWDASTRAALAEEVARWPEAPSGWMCLEARLVYALVRQPGNPCSDVDLPTAASLRGVHALLSGFASELEGDLRSASADYRAAVADGAEQGLLSPYLRVLAARLGEPTVAVDAGLWTYPLLSRQAAHWWARVPP